MTEQNTDRSEVAAPERPQDEVAARLQRAAAVISAKHGADLNQTVPAVEYDPATKKRYFDTAPIPLKRLLGSPLLQTGRWALGPNKERKLSGGWGDARSYSYNPNAPATAKHQGLDFIAPKGEQVLSCGDGRVTFVGYQSRQGGVEVEGAQQNDAGDVLDARGNVVCLVDQVGFGGIAVFVVHDGDFEGYRTEYYHLSKILVKAGSRVSEGQAIAEIGNTGLPGLKPHLHFQTAFVSAGLTALIRPTGLVPNYWPGHTDSTNITTGAGQIAPNTPTIGVAAAGAQLVTNAASNQTQASDRATIAQNQGLDQIKANQARYADLVADRLSTHQGALYATVAAFQGAGITVTAPMTFDFGAGTWSDGSPV